MTVLKTFFGPTVPRYLNVVTIPFGLKRHILVVYGIERVHIKKKDQEIERRNAKPYGRFSSDFGRSVLFRTLCIGIR